MESEGCRIDGTAMKLSRCVTDTSRRDVAATVVFIDDTLVRSNTPVLCTLSIARLWMCSESNATPNCNE